MDQTLAPAPSSDSKRRRNGMLMIGGSVVWMAIIFFGWANLKTDDTIPTGFVPVVNEETGIAEGASTTAVIRCNSLFSGDATVEPVPAVELPRVYSRPPCEGPRRDGRIAFGINVAMSILVAAGGVFVLRLAPDQRDDTADLVDNHAGGS